MLAREWISTLGFNEPAFKDRLLIQGEATHVFPYGMEMARGLESGVDAYFLAQDKPIAAFIVRDNEQDAESEIIDTQWDKLWNQGLANVLILYLPNKVRIYSLLDVDKKNKKLPYLIEEITDKIRLTIRQRIFSLEEGAFFRTHAKHFSEANRIDRKLLENLKEGRKSLMTCATPLSKSVSQILLLQVLFLAYLEDRGILPAADFSAATNGKYHSLGDLLYAGDVSALETLYAVLREQFNGDMFVSPGSFGQNEEASSSPSINAKHLEMLVGLRRGDRAASGQFSLFRLYNFAYIPVALLSAIYDHFQHEDIDINSDDSARLKKRSEKRRTGSYFTPAHLAQTCVSLAWKYLPQGATLKNNFYVLDPACGSAVFLVCVFQRLAGRLLTREKDKWLNLQNLLLRLHGCDKSESALGVGIVSLYIALLEYMEPPALSELRQQGKMLPQLLNKTMLHGDFFDFSNPVNQQTQKYDLIIGNPPWLSRQGEDRDKKADSWVGAERFTFPNISPTWGFIWKSTLLLKEEGIIAFLINASHLFSTKARKGMQQLYTDFSVCMIANFADACFQLFDGASAPAALLVYGKRKKQTDAQSNFVDFFSPKANPDYYIDKRIILSDDDHASIPQCTLAATPEILIEYKWGRSRDRALLDDLKQLFPALGERTTLLRYYGRHGANNWVLGQGLNHGNKLLPSEIQGYQYFPAHKEKARLRWAPCLADLDDFKNAGIDGVDRLRIIGPLLSKEFVPPLVLIAQGFSRLSGQLRAGYTDKFFTFTSGLQAIAAPHSKVNPNAFKILTAVLNSRLAAWFFLHAGSVSGVERDKILLEELLYLPFPLPAESPNPEVGKKIVALMDAFIKEREVEAHHVARGKSGLSSVFFADEQKMEKEASELVYDYYGLTSSERQLIEDTHNFTLPSLQPRISKAYPKLWEPPSLKELHGYAYWLREALFQNYSPPVELKVTVYQGSGKSPLAVTVVELGKGDGCFVDTADLCLQEKLLELESRWPSEFATGIHSLVQMVFAEQTRLILIKPYRVRYWMPSAAICDADRILEDLRLHHTRASR